MRPEEKIELRFVRECKKLGVKAPKYEKVKKGAPDRIVHLPGPVTLFFEFKVPGEEASPHQKEYIRFLEKLGYRAEVVDNWVYPLMIVKQVLRDAQQEK